MAGHGLLLDRPRPRKTKSAIGEVMEKWIDVRRVIERAGAEIQNRLLSRAVARLSHAINERRRYCGSGRSRPRTCCADRRANGRWSRNPDSRWPRRRRTAALVRPAAVRRRARRTLRCDAAVRAPEPRSNEASRRWGAARP